MGGRRFLFFAKGASSFEFIWGRVIVFVVVVVLLVII
jgi:hypothetical protein